MVYDVTTDYQCNTGVILQVELVRLFFLVQEERDPYVYEKTVRPYTFKIVQLLAAIKNKNSKYI